MNFCNVVSTNNFICDGMQYRFKDNELFNNYGTLVARVELASDTNYDEYNHFIDIVTGDVMHSNHENLEVNKPIGYQLVWHYVAFNQ